MSPHVWAEVRDAVAPSVAAGQLLPHRAAQIAHRYRVDIQDVTRIYTEQRDQYVARVRAVKAKKAAEIAAGLDIQYTPGTQPEPEGQPQPAPAAEPEPEPAAEPEPAPLPPAPEDGPRREPARIANPEPGVDCEHCGDHVRDNYVLAQHVRLHHPELLTHQCHLCPTRSLSRGALRKHYRKRHPGEDFPKEKPGRKPAHALQPAADPGTAQPAAAITPVPEASNEATATAAEAPPNVTIRPSLHGLRIARDLVEAFNTARHDPEVRERAEQAAVAIAVLQSVVEGHTNALAARAAELRAELERLETQLAQVQEAIA